MLGIVLYFVKNMPELFSLSPEQFKEGSQSSTQHVPLMVGQNFELSLTYSYERCKHRMYDTGRSTYGVTLAQVYV